MNRTALIELKEKVEAGLSCAAWTAAETDFAGAKWNEVYHAHQGSLDSAKALHEAVLPGWRVEEIHRKYSVRNLNGLGVWYVALENTKTMALCAAMNADPARAWLLALLSALIAMEPEEREEPREEPKEGY